MLVLLLGCMFLVVLGLLGNLIIQQGEISNQLKEVSANAAAAAHTASETKAHVTSWEAATEKSEDNSQGPDDPPSTGSA